MSVTPDSPALEAGRRLLAPGSRWRPLALRLFFILLLPMFTLVPAAQSAEAESMLAKLAVAYIYNFTRFIEWPEIPSERPFIIGVIGDKGMEAQLRVLEQDGRRAAGRPIEIRGFVNPGQIEPCEALFVGAGADTWLDEIVQRTSGKPTLLISDMPGTAGQGIAIELFRKPNILGTAERLRFRIDPKVIKDRGLVVSAQLYDVAEVIE